MWKILNYQDLSQGSGGFRVHEAATGSVSILWCEHAHARDNAGAFPVCPSTAFHSMLLIISTVDGSAHFSSLIAWVWGQAGKDGSVMKRTQGGAVWFAHLDVGAASLATASPVLPPCWGSVEMASSA